MASGVVFSIEEFAVFDGPGLRSALFLKGCPLRCQWCHNPEGLRMMPQIQWLPALCVQCGKCEQVCTHKGDCILCLACVQNCVRGARRVCGSVMQAQEAAHALGKHANLLKESGGGITFSGGECLMQSQFVQEVRALLPALHAAIETSGYANAAVFQAVASNMDLVMMDIKLIDSAQHKHFTGVDNACILDNLAWLKRSGIPFIARIPLIPGVNYTHKNLCATCAILQGAPNLVRVELLRYNLAAGAKYKGVQMQYTPQFDPATPPNVQTELFSQLNVEVYVK